VRAAASATALAFAAMAHADARWCLGMEGIGPVRAGMSVDQVLPLADWSGLERREQAESCWYLRYEGPNAFLLMIIDGRVARIELRGKSALRTISGAHLGRSEAALRAMYGTRLAVQPHKYDPQGHTITLEASGGDYGLRFETSGGKVTAIQSGPSEHLHYVEGCS
jgi:hypothetical protein